MGCGVTAARSKEAKGKGGGGGEVLSVATEGGEERGGEEREERGREADTGEGERGVGEGHEDSSQPSGDTQQREQREQRAQKRRRSTHTAAPCTHEVRHNAHGERRRRDV